MANDKEGLRNMEIGTEADLDEYNATVESTEPQEIIEECVSCGQELFTRKQKENHDCDGGSQ